MVLGLKRKLKKNLLRFFPKQKPAFIIIGPQKSGTSSLHYYLNQHPDLAGSSPKEIHYFDKWINHGYHLDWYENHFKTLSFRKKLFFESSSNYIYHESVAKYISECYPYKINFNS